jgi:serine phosphatase RsbU (regulator of sigma subunit)
VVPYRESSLTLARGDVLLVCSDGLVSCGRRGAGERVAGLAAAARAARLVDQLLEGTARSEMVDDVTILVLKATAG